MVPPAEGRQPLDKENLSRAAVFIPKLHVVSSELVRGGQPEGDGIKYLAAAGIKTVVNLRNEDVLVERERRITEANGLRFVSIPMDIFSDPDQSSFDQFLKIVSDSNNTPVFVHCLHGQDRTGTLVAAYRIARQGWTAAASYEEMVEFGFRQAFRSLTRGLYDFAKRQGRYEPLPDIGETIQDLKDRTHRFFD